MSFCSVLAHHPQPYSHHPHHHHHGFPLIITITTTTTTTTTIKSHLASKAALVEPVLAHLETLGGNNLVLAATAINGGLGLIISLTNHLSLKRHKASTSQGLATLWARETLWVITLSQGLNQLHSDGIVAHRTQHVVQGHVMRFTVRSGPIHHVEGLGGQVCVADCANKTVLVVHLVTSVHTIVIVHWPHANGAHTLKKRRKEEKTEEQSMREKRDWASVRQARAQNPGQSKTESKDSNEIQMNNPVKKVDCNQEG